MIKKYFSGKISRIEMEASEDYYKRMERVYSTSQKEKEYIKNQVRGYVVSQALLTIGIIVIAIGLPGRVLFT